MDIEKNSSAGQVRWFSIPNKRFVCHTLLAFSGLYSSYLTYQLFNGRSFYTLNRVQQLTLIGSPLIASAALFFAKKAPPDTKGTSPTPTKVDEVKPQPKINQALFDSLKHISSSETEEHYTFEGRELTLKLADITKESVDAVVNAANSALRSGGGVDGAIHAAAGTTLLEEEMWNNLLTCEAGNAALTGPHRLGEHGVKKIIHAVGPSEVRPDLLASAYTESLKLASGEQSRYTKMLSELSEEEKKDKRKDLKSYEPVEVETLDSIAFPAISTGIFGYYVEDATPVVIEAVCQFLHDNPGKLKEVHFLFAGKDSLKNYKVYKAHFEKILSQSGSGSERSSS